MIYSGFADEAGDTLEEQIKATKELGWSCIDIRYVNKVNFTDISDEEFEKAYHLLQSEKIQIPCFGSAVANSGKKVQNPEDVNYSVKALQRAFPRMKKLQTNFIRGMAFDFNADLTLEENEAEIFPVMKALVLMCEKENVIYLCENCGGYSGGAYNNLIRLAKYLNSPNFKIVYDTGNPIGSFNQMGDKPYQYQDAWDFYETVKDYIGYIHIKDQKVMKTGEIERTFPGEGQAQVQLILEDLIKNGYHGYISIEPHMHNGYEGYIEYGRRLEKMINNL